MFTYFHFAADRELTEAIVDLRRSAIAYETSSDDKGRVRCSLP